MRIVSKAPSPWRTPRLRTGTRAASSDTTAPSSHAKAVRGHLHAIPRDRLRVPAEFVERLAVFRLRIGIGDDPAADREVRGASDHGRGADRDVPVEGPIPGDVAQRAAVDAAAVRLKALDDLHRSRLRSSPVPTAREGGPAEPRD